MKHIIALMLLAVLALSTPTNLMANEKDIQYIISLQLSQNGIDPDKSYLPHQRTPAYIPIQASYDTYYIYVSSKMSISGTYKIIDASETKVSEGIVSTTSTTEQKINISSLSEGEYKLQLLVGDQTYEGTFCIE